MPRFEPVDHDPFAPRPMALMPVDNDPFMVSPEDAFAYGQGISPDATWRNLIPAAELGLSLAPGSGEAMSAWDAWKASGRGAEALSEGNYGDAASEYLNMGTGLLGAIPGAGIVARGTKRGAAWMDRNLPEGFNRLLDAVYPADPRSTTNIFAGPTAKTADHAALAKAQELAASGASRDDIWRETGWFQGRDGKWRFEIDDTGSMLKGQDKGARGRFTGLEHPELEAAYGRLAPVEGSFAPHLQPVGSYMPGRPPHVMAMGRTPEEARSVALHEFQHGAQDVEGFMSGANPQQFKSASDPYDLYRRTAGEVEARNVQSRIPMTTAERRATPPWETQDVPDDQQIVRFGNQGPAHSIPMDEASRMDRATQMGYADQPFYRGEASGNVPDQYDTAFFSRDPQYAQGFAEKGGQDAAREFRLNLTNTFSDGGALTASKYGSLVEAAAKNDPTLAKELAESVAPGKGVEWLIGFSKANPDFVVVEPGAAAFVRQAIETNSSDPVGLFRSAGFDAIDSGRDVRKLTGEGIRLKNARFDPSKASSRDIMAGIAGASLLPAYLLSTSQKD